MPALFRTFTEQQLVELRNELVGALLEYAGGEQYVSVSVGGKVFTKVARSREDLVRLINDVETALQRMNPDVYGRAVTRTLSDFSKSFIA